jgi:hypothetical protein
LKYKSDFCEKIGNCGSKVLKAIIGNYTALHIKRAISEIIMHSSKYWRSFPEK